MNILVVHEVDYLNKVVFEFQEIPEALARNGHKVFVLDVEDGSFKKPFIRLRTWFKSAVHRSANYQGPGITLMRTKGICWPGFTRLSALVFHYFFLKRFLKREKIDVIFLYSAPTNGWSVVKAAKKFNIPVVFRSIDTLHHMKHAFLRPLIKWSERFVYRHVAHVCTLTPKLNHYVTALNGNPNQITLLPPVLDTNFFRPKDRDAQFRKQWSLDERKRIIIFIGTFFKFSGLDAVLDQFKDLLKNHPRAFLLFVGGGELAGALQRQIEQNDLQDDARVIGFRPFEEMPDFLKEADLALCPFRPGPITKDIVPSKIFQYLACGVPTICTPLEGTKTLLAGSENGVLYHDLLDFGRGIDAVFSDQERLHRLRENALQFIANHHSKEQRVTALEGVFKQFVS